MIDPDLYAVIDHSRSASLVNEGCAYTAALAIDCDGTEYLMLVSPRDAGRGFVYDPMCAAVFHEQTGPLPLLFIDRLINQPKGNQPE